MQTTLTKPQDTTTSCPDVLHNPANPKYAHAHPIVVRYRLFQNSRVDSKTFGVTDEARQAMRDFVHSMGATAEIKNGTWVITDKGSVDYMTVSFVDSELLAQQEAKRAIANQMIAKWKAMKAEGTA